MTSTPSLFGEALVAAVPVIADEFEYVYGTDMGPFFTGWFVGDLVGDTATTTFMFQSARTVAWVNNFGLQNPATRDITRAEMNLAVDAASVVLDGLEAIGDRVRLGSRRASCVSTRTRAGSVRRWVAHRYRARTAMRPAERSPRRR